MRIYNSFGTFVRLMAADGWSLHTRNFFKPSLTDFDLFTDTIDTTKRLQNGIDRTIPGFPNGINTGNTRSRSQTGTGLPDKTG